MEASKRSKVDPIHQQRLLFNARILSSSKEQEEFSWMVVDSSSGLVTDIGSNDPPLDKFEASHRVDIEGHRILPGLIDAHIHVEALGRQMNSLKCR